MHTRRATRTRAGLGARAARLFRVFLLGLRAPHLRKAVQLTAVAAAVLEGFPDSCSPAGLRAAGARGATIMQSALRRRVKIPSGSVLRGAEDLLAGALAMAAVLPGIRRDRPASWPLVTAVFADSAELIHRLGGLLSRCRSQGAGQRSLKFAAEADGLRRRLAAERLSLLSSGGAADVAGLLALLSGAEHLAGTAELVAERSCGGVEHET